PPARGDDPESWRLRSDVWRDPRVVVGASDAGAHLDMLSTFSYSTSLLAASRTHGLLPLEEAVHLLTDVQARLYGVRERGRIAEGWHADLVLFDEARVAPGPVPPRPSPISRGHSRGRSARSPFTTSASSGRARSGRASATTCSSPHCCGLSRSRPAAPPRSR